MRWVKRIGMVVLVLLVIATIGAHQKLREDNEDLREAVALVAEGVSEVRSEVEELEAALEDLDEDEDVDRLRSDAETAVGRVEEEFAYICAQFTAVECLSFPNGAGR